MSKVNIHTLSTGEIHAWKVARWRARTNLGYLCRDVLNYPDVHDIYHGPVLNILQKFRKPTREEFETHDVLGKDGRWRYTPLCPMTSLDGGRRRLILDPRGHLKTTINAQSHTIQWLLNYPEAAIMVVQANLDRAFLILKEIKNHFTGNPKFRELFPEYCPDKKISEFGTKSAFTTPARAAHITRREESVMAASIEKGLAGLHFDIIKFSDIVDEDNSKSKVGLDMVNERFFLSENLLNSPPDQYWMDVEGTRYSFRDIYGKLLEIREAEIDAGKTPTYAVTVRGCYEKSIENPTYSPEELDLPDKKIDGKYVCVWPQYTRADGKTVGFTPEYYEKAYQNDPLMHFNQHRNSPTVAVDGVVPFPVKAGYPTLIRRKDYKNVPIVYRIISADLAETVNERSDYSAIGVIGISRNGHRYVEEIEHGKFLPHDLVEKIAALYLKYHKTYQPVRAIKMEEMNFNRGLSVAFAYWQQLNNIYLPLEMVKRDTQQSKADRIKNTLQPPYKEKHIILLDDLVPMKQILKELKEFPKGANDDILDMLADSFQNEDWVGRETQRPEAKRIPGIYEKAWERFMGIEDFPDEAPGKTNTYGMTGFL